MFVTDFCYDRLGSSWDLCSRLGDAMLFFHVCLLSSVSYSPYSHAKFIDPAKSHVNPETVNETYLEIRLCPFKFVSKRFF